MGVSTSDFDGERAAIEGGGVREQGAFPVEENLDGEDVALCQLQQPPDLLVPAHNTRLPSSYHCMVLQIQVGSRHCYKLVTF